MTNSSAKIAKLALLGFAVVLIGVFLGSFVTQWIVVGTCDVSLQPGAPDLGAMINSCYNRSGVTSASAGIIDARNFPNRANLFINSDPFTGGNRSGKLFLPCADIYISVHPNQPQKKMEVYGCGQSSPLSSGNQMSEEGTILRPCTGVNTPVAGCGASILSAVNQLFVVPTYSATGTSSSTTATLTTSAAHNYTFTTTSPDIASHVVVTGCSVAGYNSGGANPAYFKVLTGTGGAAPTTIKYTTAGSGLGATTGCTVQAPARQHGRYSALTSGLVNPGNYYTMWSMGGGNRGGTGGFDNLGTCSTGPTGSDFTLSGFGATLQNLAFSNDGLSGLIAVYSGNEQERGGIRDVTFNNYGGLLAANYEGNGVMFDRNSWDLNDACANQSGNGGPSHFDITHVFYDAAPVSNPTGPGAGDNSGVGIQLAGNHSESDGTPVGDGGSIGGLAQFGISAWGTFRGLNDVGKGKSNYGVWAENYDDGTFEKAHCENLLHDCFYLHGTSGWTSQGWKVSEVDYASSSGPNNGVVHFDTGTDNNLVLAVRGSAGTNPAGVRDEANRCFGATPCIVNGKTDGAPLLRYIQGQFPDAPAPQTNVTAVTASNPTAATDTQLMEIPLPTGYLNTPLQAYEVYGAGVLTTTAASVPQVTITAKLCSVSGCGSGTVTSLGAIQSTALNTTAVTNSTWSYTVKAVTNSNSTTCNFIAKASPGLVIELGNAATVADSVFTDTLTAATSPNQNCGNALFLDFFVQQSTTGASNSYKQLVGVIR